MGPWMLGAAAFVMTVWAVCGVSINVDTISPGWEDKKADIYFLLDSTRSVWIGYYKIERNFVADMVRGMDIGPDKTRVGVGLYSTHFREYVALDNALSKESLVKAIQNAPHRPGLGFTSRGIEGLRTKGLSPNLARKDVPHIGIVFTDGKSRSRQLTMDNSTLAKKEGINLFTVGVGDQVDKLEIRNIASDPKDDKTFWVSDFRDDLFGRIKRKLMASLAEVRSLQSDQGTCGRKNLTDVIFVYNEHALGMEKSMAVRNFIKTLVSEFSMDSGNVRTAIVSKECHQENIDLGKYLTQKEFLQSVDRQTGPTIGSLLRTARQDKFRQDVGGRSHASNRIVLILEGDITHTDANKLWDEARRAQVTDGVELFIVDINTRTNQKGFLEQVAANPHNIIHIPSIEDLDDYAKKFMNVFCTDCVCHFQDSTEPDTMSSSPHTNTGDSSGQQGVTTPPDLGNGATSSLVTTSSTTTTTTITFLLCCIIILPSLFNNIMTISITTDTSLGNIPVFIFLGISPLLCTTTGMMMMMMVMIVRVLQFLFKFKTS